jgi:cholera toxin transcriptional activator
LPEIPNQTRAFRFGLYELDATTGELSKDGKARPRLQGQPLEVLRCLLDRQGEVVTREELRLRLWPADTFVDYDHSLNTAVNKVREALNDSADNPRFIQTIPRRGYRFIATVQRLNGNPVLEERPAVPIQPTEVAEPAQSGEKHTSILSDPEELPAVAKRTAHVLFSLIQVMYLCFYIVSLARLRQLDEFLSQAMQHPGWLFGLLLVTALVGIPIRLYLLSAALFGYDGLGRRFLTMFPALFPLDEIWALAPILLVDWIGIGLALAATAALLYVPFAQRSLLLMGRQRSKTVG